MSYDFEENGKLIRINENGEKIEVQRVYCSNCECGGYADVTGNRRGGCHNCGSDDCS